MLRATALRCLLAMLALVGNHWAWAVEPEVLLQEQARREEVSPLCRALAVQSAEGPPEHTYRKGLCVLYGIQTPKNAALALALLRQAAGNGWVEAQLAVADTLQQGPDADQREALRWYASASAAGDVRATVRVARLTQRRNALLAAKAEAAATLQGQERTPSEGTDAPAFTPPGYHCHMFGLGKTFCHSAMD